MRFTDATQFLDLLVRHGTNLLSNLPPFHNRLVHHVISACGPNHLKSFLFLVLFPSLLPPDASLHVRQMLFYFSNPSSPQAASLHTLYSPLLTAKFKKSQSALDFLDDLLSCALELPLPYDHSWPPKTPSPAPDLFSSALQRILQSVASNKRLVTAKMIDFLCRISSLRRLHSLRVRTPATTSPSFFFFQFLTSSPSLSNLPAFKPIHDSKPSSTAASLSSVRKTFQNTPGLPRPVLSNLTTTEAYKFDLVIFDIYSASNTAVKRTVASRAALLAEPNPLKALADYSNGALTQFGPRPVLAEHLLPSSDFSTPIADAWWNALDKFFNHAPVSSPLLDIPFPPVPPSVPAQTNVNPEQDRMQNLIIERYTSAVDAYEKILAERLCRVVSYFVSRHPIPRMFYLPVSPFMSLKHPATIQQLNLNALRATTRLIHQAIANGLTWGTRWDESRELRRRRRLLLRCFPSLDKLRSEHKFSKEYETRGLLSSAQLQVLLESGLPVLDAEATRAYPDTAAVLRLGHLRFGTGGKKESVQQVLKDVSIVNRQDQLLLPGGIQRAERLAGQVLDSPFPSPLDVMRVMMDPTSRLGWDHAVHDMCVMDHADPALHEASALARMETLASSALAHPITQQGDIKFGGGQTLNRDRRLLDVPRPGRTFVEKAVQAASKFRAVKVTPKGNAIVRAHFLMWMVRSPLPHLHTELEPAITLINRNDMLVSMKSKPTFANNDLINRMDQDVEGRQLEDEQEAQGEGLSLNDLSSRSIKKSNLATSTINAGAVDNGPEVDSVLGLSGSNQGSQRSVFDGLQREALDSIDTDLNSITGGIPIDRTTTLAAEALRTSVSQPLPQLLTVGVYSLVEVPEYGMLALVLNQSLGDADNDGSLPANIEEGIKNFPYGSIRLAGQNMDDCLLTCVEDLSVLKQASNSQWCDMINFDSERNSAPSIHFHRMKSAPSPMSFFRHDTPSIGIAIMRMTSMKPSYLPVSVALSDELYSRLKDNNPKYASDPRELAIALDDLAISNYTQPNDPMFFDSIVTSTPPAVSHIASLLLQSLESPPLTQEEALALYGPQATSPNPLQVNWMPSIKSQIPKILVRPKLLSVLSDEGDSSSSAAGRTRPLTSIGVLLSTSIKKALQELQEREKKEKNRGAKTQEDPGLDLLSESKKTFLEASQIVSKRLASHSQSAPSEIQQKNQNSSQISSSSTLFEKMKNKSRIGQISKRALKLPGDFIVSEGRREFVPFKGVSIDTNLDSPSIARQVFWSVHNANAADIETPDDFEQDKAISYQTSPSDKNKSKNGTKNAPNQTGARYETNNVPSPSSPPPRVVSRLIRNIHAHRNYVLTPPAPSGPPVALSPLEDLNPHARYAALSIRMEQRANRNSADNELEMESRVDGEDEVAEATVEASATLRPKARITGPGMDHPMDDLLARGEVSSSTLVAEVVPFRARDYWNARMLTRASTTADSANIVFKDGIIEDNEDYEGDDSNALLDLMKQSKTNQAKGIDDIIKDDGEVVLVKRKNKNGNPVESKK